MNKNDCQKCIIDPETGCPVCTDKGEFIYGDMCEKCKQEENESWFNEQNGGDATWTNRRLSLMVVVVGITTHLCSIAPETGQRVN